jgi:hypothetical protein
LSDIREKVKDSLPAAGRLSFKFYVSEFYLRFL